jgi:hypothetical protein
MRTALLVLALIGTSSLLILMIVSRIGEGIRDAIDTRQEQAAQLAQERLLIGAAAMTGVPHALPPLADADVYPTLCADCGKPLGSVESIR